MPEGEPFATSCVAIEDRLSDYLDGELEPALREHIQHHIRCCTECSQLALELAAVILALRTLSCGGCACEPEERHPVETAAPAK